MKRERNYPKLKKAHGRKKVAAAFFPVLFAFIFLIVQPVLAKGEYTPVKVPVAVYCEKIEGKDSEYIIAMERTDERAPKPDKDSLNVQGDETAVFQLDVTEPGTFLYKVYQRRGSEGGIQYDDKEYDIYLCVLNDENGNLVYSVTVTLAGTDQKPEKISFANTWKDEEPSSDNPPSDRPSEDNPPREITPSSGHTDNASSRTGETNGLVIAFYGGAILLLSVGAAIYCRIKKMR